MLCVILSHSINPYTLEQNRLYILLLGPLFLMDVSLMPAFFMISGYGFRKGPSRKTLRRQAQIVLLPYAYTTVAVTIVHGICHYAAFHSLSDSVRVTMAGDRWIPAGSS